MDQRRSPDPPGTGEPNGRDHGEAAQGATNLPEEPPFEHSGTPPTLTEAAAAIERLRHELAQNDARSKQNEDQLLRVRAELENFKRRMQREKAEALRFANEPLLRDLLAVIDNLERALAAAARVRKQANGQCGSEFDALVTGVEMVLASFREILGRYGVSRVVTTGATFDPSRHEALAQVETHELPAGGIVEEYTPGYTLHDRLLRAAQVVVAKTPTDKREDAWKRQNS